MSGPTIDKDVLLRLASTLNESLLIEDEEDEEGLPEQMVADIEAFSAWVMEICGGAPEGSAVH